LAASEPERSFTHLMSERDVLATCMMSRLPDRSYLSSMSIIAYTAIAMSPRLNNRQSNDATRMSELPRRHPEIARPTANATATIDGRKSYKSQYRSGLFGNHQRLKKRQHADPTQSTQKANRRGLVGTIR